MSTILERVAAEHGLTVDKDASIVFALLDMSLNVTEIMARDAIRAASCDNSQAVTKKHIALAKRLINL